MIPFKRIRKRKRHPTPWLTIARRELASKVSEVRGGENPRIIEYHASTTLKATEDEVAWCSAFVNWCLLQAKFEGTNSAAARSWLNWGNAVDDLVPGDIVIFWRGSPDSWQGHVGFFLEKHQHTISVLGGNQGNSVSVKDYPISRLLGARRPWMTEAMMTQMNQD